MIYWIKEAKKLSEQKPVSPLLDGFVLGNPMGNHDGIVCYPAMKENTDEKYIVKIISIPESQVQLDALLLTGAYKDPASAMDYFKEQADGIVEEAQLLNERFGEGTFTSADYWPKLFWLRQKTLTKIFSIVFFILILFL